MLYLYLHILFLFLFVISCQFDVANKQYNIVRYNMVRHDTIRIQYTTIQYSTMRYTAQTWGKHWSMHLSVEDTTNPRNLTPILYCVVFVLCSLTK